MAGADGGFDAGDCLSAGFIKAWLMGRPVRECLRWGSVVGGLSTLALGGTGRAITVEDVSRHLEKGESQTV